jgi:hypothetical protein
VDEPYATRREFDDFREETRDEIKWIRRFLIGVLLAGLGGNLVSALVSALIRQPAP